MIKQKETGSGKSEMAAGKLQLRISLLPDKISTKFQRLFQCFRSRAFHWDSWEYYWSKPEVEKFKMETSELQLRVSALSVKISTEFQRLYLPSWGPEFYWNLWKWYATKPKMESTKSFAYARLFDLFFGNDTHMITKLWSTSDIYVFEVQKLPSFLLPVWARGIRPIVQLESWTRKTWV